MPLLYLTTSIFLLFDSVFVGSFRKALAPVNGRIIDVLVGVFLAQLAQQTRAGVLRHLQSIKQAEQIAP